MDDADLLLRIRVITISARAAARSLRSADLPRTDVARRGAALLEALAPLVEEHGSDEVRGAFAAACSEVALLDGDP